MAALKPSETARFIASGCLKTPLILLHGPDEGLVRLRAKAIARAILGEGADPLSRLDYDAESLNSDHGRLLDEANAIAMFGGKRVILVGNAGKLQKVAWQLLFQVPPLDSTIIFQADDLAKTSPLRVAAEQSGDAVAIACYAPSRQDLQEIIDRRAQENGLSITPVARAYLAELLGADQALSEQEIEKLILYCKGRLAIDVADIDTMITDSSELSGSEPIDRAFEGKLEDVESVALRSFREGINPSGLLAMAINHALLLRRLAHARQNSSLDAALRAERVFFRRQDRVKLQAGLWDQQGLARTLDVLASAQDQTRHTPGLEEIIAIRALWSIALASRRR